MGEDSDRKHLQQRKKEVNRKLAILHGKVPSDVSLLNSNQGLPSITSNKNETYDLNRVYNIDLKGFKEGSRLRESMLKKKPYSEGIETSQKLKFAEREKFLEGQRECDKIID